MNKTSSPVKWRIAKSTIAKSLVILFAFACVLPLVAIFFYIIKEGITKINWSFFANIPKPVGETGGGVANGLLGSLIIVLCAAVIAIPIGILCGIYLSENKTSKLAYYCRLAVDILQGVPSIVIGIIIYFWLVKPILPFTGKPLGFSALSGSVALALMMLPIIIRSTEETLKLLPDSLREAGYALGLPYHKVVMRILVPCGISGVMSGVILSVARVAGETAPLLFTAFGNPYLTANILQPMDTLPHLIFNYATSPYQEWQDLAWGAAIILMLWVLLLNIITKITTRRWRVQL
jgi:phosphate transport system permease protein